MPISGKPKPTMAQQSKIDAFQHFQDKDLNNHLLGIISAS